jgi:hypothetical protein
VSFFFIVGNNLLSFFFNYHFFIIIRATCPSKFELIVSNTINVQVQKFYIKPETKILILILQH